MAKKKGGKKKGGKGKGKGKGKKDKVPLEQAPPPEPPTPVQVIRVNYTMFPGSAPWNFLDFSEVVPVETRIFWLRDCVIDRHGGSINAHDLSLYLESPTNPLEDLQKTLLDAGVAGFADGVEDEIAVTIYYDFSPTQSDKSWTCPLLLSDPITVQLRVPEAVGTKLKTGTKAGGEAAEGFHPISHQASSSLGFRAPKPAVPEASAAAEPEIEGAPA